MSARAPEVRYEYVVDAPGSPEHGQILSFGSYAPRMYARERYQLRDGRLVWIHYRGQIEAVQS